MEEVESLHYKKEEISYSRHRREENIPTLISNSKGVNPLFAQKVIQKNFARLTSLPKDWLADELLSRELLSMPRHKSIIASSDQNLSTALMDTFDIIKHCPERFPLFLDIFKDDPAYRIIAESMTAQYHELECAQQDQETGIIPSTRNFPPNQLMLPLSESSGRYQCTLTQGNSVYNVSAVVKHIPQHSSRKERGEFQNSAKATSQMAVQTSPSSSNSSAKEELGEVDEEDLVCDPVQVRSVLSERYSAFAPTPFFDPLIVDTISRGSVGISDITLACSEESITGVRPCVLLEGECGSGKTTLLRYLAHQWAVGSILTDFHFVLLYDVYVCSDVKHVCNLTHVLEEDQKLLKRASSGQDVLVLVDCFMHLPETCIQTCKEYFPNASILITAQPEFLTPVKYSNIRSISQYFKILGYHSLSVTQCIECLFKQSGTLNHLESFQAWLDRNPFAQALVYRPLYCKMLVELSLSNALPHYLVNVTTLFRVYILHLIGKHLVYPVEYYSDLVGNDDLTFRSIVDFSFSLPLIVKKDAYKYIDSFGLLNAVDFHDSSILTFFNSSIMAYFMALFCSVSPYTPVDAPMNWTPFGIFVGGLKKFDLFNELKADKIHQVIFELQPSTQSFKSLKNISESIFHCSDADPVDIYSIGWYSHVCSDINTVSFEMSHVSDLATYVKTFCNGYYHGFYQPPVKPLSSTNLRVNILHARDDVDECLKHFIAAGLGSCVQCVCFTGKLQSSDSCSVERGLSDALRLCESLCMLSVENVSLLFLENIFKCVDLPKLRILKIVSSSLSDSVMSYFFDGLASYVAEIHLINCVMSPIVAENLAMWLLTNREALRLLLEGEGVVTTELAMRMTSVIDNVLALDDTANEKTIILRDASAPAVALVYLVQAASKHRNILKIGLLPQYRIDFNHFPLVFCV